MDSLVFTNARVVLPDRILEQGYVSVKNGIIQTVGPGEPPDELPHHSQIKIIDCENNYLSPGFIDTHCHGGGGADFMDGTTDDILIASRAHLKHGTTGLCPTTLTCSDDELFQFFECYKEAKIITDQMPHLLGIHLEGPYFSPSQAGAQPPEYLVSPQKEHYQKILQKGGDNIVKWSVAPELAGAMELGDELRSRGILALMGHSDAKYDIILKAMDHGYTQLTHFYSAMSTITREHGHRKLGLVEAGYLHDQLTIEIIADGIHLPPELLKLITKLKPHDHICLVTDSMRGADMPDGPSLLGSKAHGVPVIIRDGIANMPTFDSFAGSIATTDRLARVMVQEVGLPVWDAVRMVSLNPAAFLGKNDLYGSIEPGKSADLLIFDENIQISSVYVAGTKQF